MKVTFLGTGTSQGIPVIACDCHVCTSDDPKDDRLRVSVHIQTDDKSIVIDTGPDFRQQMLRSGVRELDAILFTHEHKDHVAGLDDVRAFNFRTRTNMPLYATERVQKALKREFYYAFEEEKYPGVPDLELHTINKDPFYVGNNEVIPIAVMHYKLPVLGFRIGDFAYITDANYISPEEKRKLSGLKVLVLNALRREPHVSHFTLDEAVQLAQELKAEETYFTHISHLMGTHAETEKDLPDGIHIAYDGLALTV